MFKEVTTVPALTLLFLVVARVTDTSNLFYQEKENT